MTSDPATTVPGAAHQYYAVATYWNNLPEVIRRLNVRATGDPDVAWYQHVIAQGRRYERALVLNCGNGWVERDLLREGLVERTVGVDLDTGSLAAARQAAADEGLAAEYVELDINLDDLPSGPFDLVVNHAAAHHIASIDRVMRQIAERMTADGLFLHYDYVGAHRNQFDAITWERAWEVNKTLPPALRQHLVYPHLGTMLDQDPTEAIHSELIVPTLERYFDIEQLRPLGGGVGYLLLTHNAPLHAADPDERDPIVERIMDEDQRFVDEHPGQSLFAFILARPRAGTHDPETLLAWTDEERQRESRARQRNGAYYPPTLLAELYYGPAAERGEAVQPAPGATGEAAPLPAAVVPAPVESTRQQERAPGRATASVRARRAARRIRLLGDTLRSRRPPRFDRPVSQRVTVADESSAAVRRWSGLLGPPVGGAAASSSPVGSAFVLEVLDQRDILRPGRTALGLECGHDPLPAVVASFGTAVVATARTIAPDLVVGGVTWEAADVTAIPPHLRGFDALWSAGVLPHLATVQTGLDVVLASIDCLRPAGVAVHLLELAVDPDAPVATAAPVVHRRRDVEALVLALRHRGHGVTCNFHHPGATGSGGATAFGLVVVRDGHRSPRHPRRATLPPVTDPPHRGLGGTTR